MSYLSTEMRAALVTPWRHAPWTFAKMLFVAVSGALFLSGLSFAFQPPPVSTSAGTPAPKSAKPDLTVKPPDKSLAKDFVIADRGSGSAIPRWDHPMVGGAPMSASKNIVESAVRSKDHSTLVSAVKAAGLFDTLEGVGPFTVFAPTNEAFKKLPAILLKPENKAELKAVLTYHVVPGALTTQDLKEKIRAGGGRAKLTTIQGEPLTAELSGKGIDIIDARGDVANVTIANVRQSNGVIHVVNSVLLP